MSKQYRVQVTGDQRKDIDPDQIAQILLDPIRTEPDTERKAPGQGSLLQRHGVASVGSSARNRGLGYRSMSWWLADELSLATCLPLGAQIGHQHMSVIRFMTAIATAIVGEKTSRWLQTLKCCAAD